MDAAAPTEGGKTMAGSGTIITSLNQTQAADLSKLAADIITAFDTTGVFTGTLSNTGSKTYSECCQRCCRQPQKIAAAGNGIR